MSDNDDIFSGLSAETLRALKEFALQSGVAVDDGEGENECGNAFDLINSVQKHFRLQDADREEIFPVHYESRDKSRVVDFKVKGIKKELGQTLQSTGLTM